MSASAVCVWMHPNPNFGLADCLAWVWKNLFCSKSQFLVVIRICSCLLLLQLHFRLFFDVSFLDFRIKAFDDIMIGFSFIGTKSQLDPNRMLQYFREGKNFQTGPMNVQKPYFKTRLKTSKETLAFRNIIC